MSNGNTGLLVSGRDLRKSYDAGRVQVLAGVGLEVRAGEMVALWGASGSGKSTLLHLLGGLDVPDSGELSVCGLDPRLEENRLELRRRHVGFVFQLHNLIADLTVEENIRVPAWLRAGRRLRRKRSCVSWRTRSALATDWSIASRIFPAASASAPPSVARS